MTGRLDGKAPPFDLTRLGIGRVGVGAVAAVHGRASVCVAFTAQSLSGRGSQVRPGSVERNATVGQVSCEPRTRLNGMP